MTKTGTETDVKKIEIETGNETDEKKTASRTRTKLRTALPETDVKKIEIDEKKTALRTRTKLRKALPNTNASLGLPTHRPSPSTKQSRLATNPKNAAAASPMTEDAAAANADPTPITGRVQTGRGAQNLDNFLPS